MRSPFVAIGLTIAAGFFILLGGLFVALLGVALYAIGFHAASILFIGPLLGILLWVMAGLMWAFPRGHVAWGAIVIVISVVSIPFTLAGLILGFLLGLAGGVLAIVHRPAPRAPAGAVAWRLVPPESPP
ncbi:MAG TPA: DUF6114 domain-containing protein [Thermoplasmata archaeon]|nr:DUF6114 domain-containing protein [Thermoplasmata archaeon]